MENKVETKIQDYSTWNLFKKMLHIENEIQTVKKDMTVKLPNGSYRAVAEIDVLNAIKPIEFKYGVKSLPIDREIIESKETETKSGTINQFIRIKTTFRFINVDIPTDYIDVISFGDGVDSGDKASGKGQTYADKYALLKSYKIGTGDDPDQNASEEQKTKTETKATSQQIELIKGLLNNNIDHIQYTLDTYKVKGLMDLTVKQASEVISKIRAKKESK